jgi:hypothetical protein
MLTKEQSDFVAHVTERRSVLLTGKAGAGKTFVVNKAKQELDSLGLKHLSLSFTASSAKLVGGHTVQSFFLTSRKAVPSEGYVIQSLSKVRATMEEIYTSSGKKHLSMLHQIISMARVDVVFVDEISMISPVMLYVLVKCFELAKSFSKDKRFSKLTCGEYDKEKFHDTTCFVFSGDFFQIPPITTRGVKRNSDGHSNVDRLISLGKALVLRWKSYHDDDITLADYRKTFEEFEVVFKRSVRQDVDLRNFTVAMLKQMSTQFSSWILQNMRDTRYVFDDFTDVPLQGATAVKKNAYKSLQFTRVDLTSSQRQKGDASFERVLDLLRMGGFASWDKMGGRKIHPDHIDEEAERWPEDLKRLLKSRIGAKVPDSAVRMYFKNEEANGFNLRQLSSVESEMFVLKPQEFWVKGQTKTDLSKSPHPIAKVQEFKELNCQDCRDLDEVHIKIGAKVIITRNVDKAKGIINGRTGTVLAVKPSGAAVEVLTDDGARHWIERVETSHHMGGDEYYVIRHVPLILGWAITTCRSQGMTLSFAEVNLSMQFSFGHLYTAVSRVKDLESLSLVLPTSKTSKKPISLDFFMETQCLSCHPIAYQITP